MQRACRKPASDQITIFETMTNNKSLHPSRYTNRTPAAVLWVTSVLLLQACASTTGSRAPAMNIVSGSLDGKLMVCSMDISNAPAAVDGQVVDFKPTLTVNGVQLLSAPIQGACMSSGFGMRHEKMHKGVDYFQRPGGLIYVAGDGVVVEKVYRRDYGRMVLIDHGAGVYTRYAHLRSYSDGFEVGKKVQSGEVMGRMGRSGNTRAEHLHYEILTGDYSTPKGSFGLKPRNPL